MGIVGLICLICAVWVIYEVWTKQKRMSDTDKLIWTICAIIFNVITAIVYFLKYKR